MSPVLTSVERGTIILHMEPTQLQIAIELYIRMFKYNGLAKSIEARVGRVDWAYDMAERMGK